MSDLGYTRRRLLGAAVASAGGTLLAGCGVFGGDPAPEPAADVLRPLLDESVGLTAIYQRAISAQPGLDARLTALANDHRAHAAELARVIGTVAPSAGLASGATADDVAGLLAQLRIAEQNAQRSAAALCLTVPADRAALVGSIAACRAAHVEALR